MNCDQVVNLFTFLCCTKGLWGLTIFKQLRCTLSITHISFTFTKQGIPFLSISIFLVENSNPKMHHSGTTVYQNNCNAFWELAYKNNFEIFFIWQIILWQLAHNRYNFNQFTQNPSSIPNCFVGSHFIFKLDYFIVKFCTSSIFIACFLDTSCDMNGKSDGGFFCAGSSWCIPKADWCDGVRHCPSGEDEKDCPGEMPMCERLEGWQLRLIMVRLGGWPQS